MKALRKPNRCLGDVAGWRFMAFYALSSMCGLFLPHCGALSAVEKLKWLFVLCLLNHCFILTLDHKVVLAQPVIISITCWFLRRAPSTAELITASVLNNCCSVLSHLLSLPLSYTYAVLTLGHYSGFHLFPGGSSTMTTLSLSISQTYHNIN